LCFAEAGSEVEGFVVAVFSSLVIVFDLCVFGVCGGDGRDDGDGGCEEESEGEFGSWRQRFHNAVGERIEVMERPRCICSRE